MAKELNPFVVALYQPHQNIRQHELLAEAGYAHCFDSADQVYWLPTYLSREDKNLEIIKQDALIASTQKAGEIEPAEMNDELWGKITKHIAQGHLVLAMSAGDLDKWLREKAQEL